MTATARKPSISGRNPFCGGAVRPLAVKPRRETDRGAVATLFTRETIVSRDPELFWDQRATSTTRLTLAVASPARPLRRVRRRTRRQTAVYAATRRIVSWRRRTGHLHRNRSSTGSPTAPVCRRPNTRTNPPGRRTRVQQGP